MTHAIVPTTQLGDRMPEAGRIRLGMKSGNAMKSIKTFRFTSPSEKLIDQIAQVYGSKVGPRPWSDAKASPRDQFEVITSSSEIRIFLPPDSVSTFYEQWTGGGCSRRCDGVQVTIAGRSQPEEVPCICSQPKPNFPDGVMECKPYTRLNVIIPEVDFQGTWRLETKGWNAAHEMPGMASMIEQLHTRGLAEARLRLDQESQMQQGKMKHFVVPRLLIAETPQAMLEGGAQVALMAGDQLALPAATPEAEDLENTAALDVPVPGTRPEVEETEWFDQDDEIVDAEIVEPTPPPATDEVPPVVADAFPGAEVVAAVHYWDEASNGFLCFETGNGVSTSESDKITCSGCEAEWNHRNANKGQPAGRAKAAAKRTSKNPTLTKFVLATEEIANSLVGAQALTPIPDVALKDEVRHAFAWWASKKATDSAKALAPEAMTRAINGAEKCKVNLPQAVKVVEAYRGRPM